MRLRMVAQTGLTGDPKKRTRFSRSRSLNKTRILCRHLESVKNQSTNPSMDVCANSQYDKFPQACFDVEIVDVVVCVVDKRLVIGTPLNPEHQTPVKFVVSLFEQFRAVKVARLKNLIDNYVELDFDVSEKGESRQTADLVALAYGIELLISARKHDSLQRYSPLSERSFC